MKKAIVIGATSGIGRETAARLVEEGWMVGVTGRRVEALKSFKAEYGDNVHFMEMDVTKEDATVGLDELIGEMGAPDLLLYVSGVGYQNLELDMDKEIRTVKTNCEGLVRMVVHFINYVRNHQELYSADHEAHIAVVTSIAGTAGLGTAPSYSATKKMQQTYISALTQLVRMEGLPVDSFNHLICSLFQRHHHRISLVGIKNGCRDEPRADIRKTHRKSLHPDQLGQCFRFSGSTRRE